MDNIYNIITLFPLFSSFTCLCILLLSLLHKDSVSAILRLILIVFTLSISCNWLYINTIQRGGLKCDNVFILLPFFNTIALIVPIVFYHFVFCVTRLNVSEKMPWKHYILPAAVLLVSLIVVLIMPTEHKQSMIGAFYDNGNSQGSSLFSGLPYARAVLIILYSVLSFKRIHRYRKTVVNYSSDEERISLNWLYVLVIVLLCQLIIPLFAVLLGLGKKQGQLLNLYIIIPVMLIVWQNISLVYNLLMGNFILLYEKNHSEDVSEFEETVINSSKEKLQQKLEYYLENEKPYLKPDLRITELIKPLETNRTTLSSLINEVYQMNFCRFINSYRLAEYNRLRNNPENSELTNAELIQLSGFSNYKAYMRTKHADKNPD